MVTQTSVLPNLSSFVIQFACQSVYQSVDEEWLTYELHVKKNLPIYVLSYIGDGNSLFKHQFPSTCPPLHNFGRRKNI